MKKYLVLIICVILCINVTSAQENTIVEENTASTNDTIVKFKERSSATLNGLTYNVMFSWKKKPLKSHWSGIEFAFSDLDNLQDATLIFERSYSVKLNISDFTVPLSHHWLFVSGWGLDFSRYHFKGNIGLQEGKDGISSFVPDELNRDYESNKLIAYYITIPILLEYQKKVGSSRTFYLNGGVEGLIKYYSKSQLDIRTQERGLAKVNYKNLNILPVNARFILRAGFNSFGIFGYYQPFSMFKNGKGPDIYPFGIGISLN
jgi:hypothetical protein